MEKRIVNTFIGEGLLSNYDDVRQTVVLQNVVIRECINEVPAPTGTSAVTTQIWVDVEFSSNPPITIACNPSFPHSFWLIAIGELNETVRARARVNNIVLNSLSHGIGEEVKFEEVHS